jgi:hypothetical protein
MALYLYAGSLIGLNGGNPFTVESADEKLEALSPANRIEGAILVHVAVVPPSVDNGHSLGVHRRMRAWLNQTFSNLIDDTVFWVSKSELTFLANRAADDKENLHGSQYDNVPNPDGSEWTKVQEHITDPTTPEAMFGARGEPIKGSIRITPQHGEPISMDEDRFVIFDLANSVNGDPKGLSFLLLDRYLAKPKERYRGLFKFADWTKLSEEMISKENADIVAPYIFGLIVKNPRGNGYLATIPTEKLKVAGFGNVIGCYNTLFQALCGSVAFHVLTRLDYPGKDKSDQSMIDFNFSGEFIAKAFG